MPTYITVGPEGSDHKYEVTSVTITEVRSDAIARHGVPLEEMAPGQPMPRIGDFVQLWEGYAVLRMDLP